MFLGAFGVIAVAFGLFYWWQPWEVDLVPRHLPPTTWIEPDLDRLYAPGTRVAIVVGHPDDPEFYVGAFLTRLKESGARMTLILTTDGDKGYYPFGNPREIARIRREEQRRASALWGCTDLRFLAFPDGRLRASEPVVAAIERELRQIRPEFVLTFDDLYPPRASHADHRRTGEASMQALRRMDYRGWALLFQTAAPNFVFDATTRWPAKLEALAQHESQWSSGSDDWTFIQNLVRGHAVAFGKMRGYELGEGMRAVRYGPPRQAAPEAKPDAPGPN